MEKSGYVFYLFVTGTEKGKRKEKTQKIHLGFYEESLSPELFNEVERKAWRLADEQLKKSNNTGTLSAHKARESGEMVMVNLLAEQSQLVLRG